MIAQMHSNDSVFVVSEAVRYTGIDSRLEGLRILEYMFYQVQ